MTRRIDVIVPTLNRVAMTHRCLTLLAEQTRRPDSVTVVDSGSSDGTPAMVSREYPRATCIPVGRDVWWTGAVRRGIAHVRARQPAYSPDDAVLLLNDDLSFEPDFVERIAAEAALHPRTLLGAVVLDEDRPDRITHGGCRIDWRTARWRQLNRNRTIDAFAPDHVETVDALSGRGVWIPRSVFDEIGSYRDDRLPQHGDYEFSIRAARAGHVLLTPYSVRVWCDFAITTDLNHRPLTGWSDLVDAFASLRSYANLRERIAFARLTCRGGWHLSRWLAWDLARTGTSVLRRWRPWRFTASQP